MPTDDIRIRPLRDDDLPFLHRMLAQAACWRTGRMRPPRRWLSAALDVAKRFIVRRYLAMYEGGWGRPGDTALVAEADGRPIGATWYRLFTAAEHGEGFVDEATPELVIAVEERWRGHGVGRRLLEAIHERARSDGIAQIALSVDADNPARRLYSALGYRELGPADPEGRMILRLR